MIIYIIIVVILILLGYFFATYNKLIRLNNRVNEAFSTMDVCLKKRWDLIPNIVEVVKGYTKHESETFKEVVELRSNVYDTMPNNEKLEKNEKLANQIGKLMAIAEAYPDLKASEEFTNLSKQLTQIENEIANSRKYYNGTVRIFNNKVEMFPSNIIANILGYKTKTMFEASTDERKNIKVEV